MNPVRARLVATPSEYAYCSAHPGFELDSPTAAKAGALGVPERTDKSSLYHGGSNGFRPHKM